MSEPITTDELLDAAEERTGLARNQILMMVAKSAAVRHVATSPDGDKRFVLKGGTLLTHVYQSPRQSIGDADYLHLDRDTIETDTVEAALRFREGTFTMEPSLRYDDRTDSFSGKGVFSFEDIQIRRKRDRELKITVSVRTGERLDEPEEELIYRDPTLTGVKAFPIEGLTINELSSEKILAWSSKDLAKHLVDLAYVAREWEAKVDHDRVAELVRQKFAVEGRSRRYRDLGISTPAHLVARFRDPERLKRLLHDGWERLARDEVFFLPAEEQIASERQLVVARNVEAFALEFWEPTLRKL